MPLKLRALRLMGAPLIWDGFPAFPDIPSILGKRCTRSRCAVRHAGSVTGAPSPSAAAKKDLSGEESGVRESIGLLEDVGRMAARGRKKHDARELNESRRRALLADIITSNKSAFKPGLNPDMDAAERDALVWYIESLERWEAGLGRAAPKPTVEELDWRAGVLKEEITSWTHILLNEPALSSGERSDLVETVGEFERWRAELKAQKGAMASSLVTAAGSRRRGRGSRKQG